MNKKVFDGSHKTLDEGVHTWLQHGRDVLEKRGKLDHHLLLMQKNGKLHVVPFKFSNEAQKTRIKKKMRNAVNALRPEATFVVSEIEVLRDDFEKFEGIMCVARSACEIRVATHFFTRNENGSIAWGEEIECEGSKLTDYFLEGCSYQRKGTYIQIPPETFLEYLSRGLEDLLAVYNARSQVANDDAPAAEQAAELIGRVADIITHYEQTRSEEDEAVLFLMCIEGEMTQLQRTDPSKYSRVKSDDDYGYALSRMGTDAPDRFARLVDVHGFDWLHEKYQEFLKGGPGIWVASK